MDEKHWTIINPILFAGLALLIFLKYSVIKDYLITTFKLTETQLLVILLVIAGIVIYTLKKGKKIVTSNQRSLNRGTNPLILVAIFALLIVSYPRLSELIKERTTVEPTTVFIILIAVLLYGVYAYNKY